MYIPWKKSYDQPAAAKSLQLCLTLCDPVDGSPPGSRPWDSPGKSTGVDCHCILQCMKVKREREVAQSCQLFATLWNAAYQAPPSMGFSRQEYWHIKKQRHYFANKGPSTQSYGFSSSHVGCESWTESAQKAEH